MWNTVPPYDSSGIRYHLKQFSSDDKFSTKLWEDESWSFSISWPTCECTRGICLTEHSHLVLKVWSLFNVYSLLSIPTLLQVPIFDLAVGTLLSEVSYISVLREHWWFTHLILIFTLNRFWLIHLPYLSSQLSKVRISSLWWSTLGHLKINHDINKNTLFENFWACWFMHCNNAFQWCPSYPCHTSVTEYFYCPEIGISSQFLPCWISAPHLLHSFVFLFYAGMVPWFGCTSN